MINRRHLDSFEDQLYQLAQKYRELAQELAEGPEQNALLSKAQKIDLALRRRINSPRLAPK